MSSVQRIRDAEKGYVPTVNIHSGPKVDAARNELFQTWLTETPKEVNRILMLDTDMSYPAETARRLRSHNRDIVGGLYFAGGWASPVRPVISKTRETEEGSVILEPYWDYPVNTLCEVVGLGGGFMMVTRRCAEAVWEARGEDHPMPWFAHGMHHGVQIGEDVAFCITAQKVGYSVWCDTGLEADHMKSLPLNHRNYVAGVHDPSHPCYNLRGEIPIVQELANANSSLNGDRPSLEGLPAVEPPGRIDLGPDDF